MGKTAIQAYQFETEARKSLELFKSRLGRTDISLNSIQYANGLANGTDKLYQLQKQNWLDITRNFLGPVWSQISKILWTQTEPIGPVSTGSGSLISDPVFILVAIKRGIYSEIRNSNIRDGCLLTLNHQQRDIPNISHNFR